MDERQTIMTDVTEGRARAEGILYCEPLMECNAGLVLWETQRMASSCHRGTWIGFCVETFLPR